MPRPGREGAVQRLAARGRALRFRLGIRRQLVRKRLAAVPGLDRHLPWWLWLQLCGWNADVVAEAIGRFSPPGLHFLQIGANDGLRFDPISTSVRRYGWQGTLVEPIPWIFERLQENYAGVPGLRFVNAAVANVDGTMPMFYVEHSPGDPDYYEGLFSFDESVLRSHGDRDPDFAARVRTTDVKTTTLRSLVADQDIDRIDLLHMDTEGQDLEILKQVDFDAPWAPRFVIFEIKHLSGPEAAEARRLLRRAGYRWFPIWHDAFAYRDSPTRPA